MTHIKTSIKSRVAEETEGFEGKVALLAFSRVRVTLMPLTIQTLQDNFLRENNKRKTKS